MTDLQDVKDDRYTAQMDSAGWIFAAVVVVITGLAAGLVACHSDGLVAISPVTPHVAASR
jgi:hypothetical protein